MDRISGDRAQSHDAVNHCGGDGRDRINNAIGGVIDISIWVIEIGIGIGVVDIDGVMPVSPYVVSVVGIVAHMSMRGVPRRRHPARRGGVRAGCVRRR